MTEFIKPEDWINARERFSLPRRIEPPIDEVISQIVGKKIYTQDPRLLKLIVKWKKQSGKAVDNAEPDNFLKDPKKIAELREVLSQGF